ncbi:DUF1934 domain-containing protein [Paenibacillus physcomitrellae]|uniref:DUF1934 domain-containing protein n=1 Tax=Paenibacillus physcomitrellae TaxID=1619311 RepID=A0ABQ1H0A5_9BACL|nr:DUF1934 domain-containing protein [Paenibacillus physcomitrellae]GGA52942.1 hypothetical protein GCM10010917_42710 [Paenibacillus physcomitrellae]
MPGNQAVVITLTSFDGTDKTVQHMRGELVQGAAGSYIRYEEPEPGPKGGKTRTTVRISGGELRVLRHGEVESQQTFSAGQKLPGFYRSPFTTFNLSTDTKSVDIRLDGSNGTLDWVYDLYVYEELAGRFTISLQIQEEV